MRFIYTDAHSHTHAAHINNQQQLLAVTDIAASVREMAFILFTTLFISPALNYGPSVPCWKNTKTPSKLQSHTQHTVLNHVETVCFPFCKAKSANKPPESNILASNNFNFPHYFKLPDGFALAHTHTHTHAHSPEAHIPSKANI